MAADGTCTKVPGKSVTCCKLGVLSPSPADLWTVTSDATGSDRDPCYSLLIALVAVVRIHLANA